MLKTIDPVLSADLLWVDRSTGETPYLFPKSHPLTS